MKTFKKISFVGFGHLASAIVEGALASQVFSADALTVSSPSLSEKKRSTSFKVAASNAQAVSEADVIVIAVKPKQMALVCQEIGSYLRKNQLIISVAAGKTISSIQQYLGRQDIAIVRAMPNTAVAVGQGITGIYASTSVEKADREFAQKLFESTGMVVDVAEEHVLDFITAFSGSGPAYFLYLQEALEHAAIKHGFSKKLAEKIVKQLMYGTSLLTWDSDATFKEKRAQITSEKGTTATAIAYLEQHDFMKMIEEMLDKAMLRAKALSISE